MNVLDIEKLKDKTIAFVGFRDLKEEVERYFSYFKEPNNLDKIKYQGKHCAVDWHNNRYILFEENDLDPDKLRGYRFDYIIDIDYFRHQLYSTRITQDNPKLQYRNYKGGIYDLRMVVIAFDEACRIIASYDKEYKPKNEQKDFLWYHNNILKIVRKNDSLIREE